MLAVGAVCVLAAAPAAAGTQTLNADVRTALTGDDFVSYSRAGFPVWAAFTVTISNSAPNNISNAKFTFSNNLGTTFKVPTIASNGNAQGSCVADPDPRSIVCNISSAGDSLTFTLQTLSPSTDLASPPDATMTIDWRVQSGQGTNTNNSGIANQNAGLIVIKQGSTTDLRGYVDSQTPLTVGNAAGTQTKILPSQAATAALKQEVSPSSCSPHYTICLNSTVTIEDADGNPILFDPPLIIDLNRDKSTFKKGAKIANATLTYTPKVGDPYTINPCLQNSPGVFTIGPLDDRCVIPVTKPANPYSYVDPVTGAWHFRVLGKTNGIISW